MPPARCLLRLDSLGTQWKQAHPRMPVMSTPLAWEQLRADAHVWVYRYALSWAGGLSGSAEIMQIMHSTCSDRLEPSRAQRSVVRDTAGGSVRGTVLAGGLQKIDPRRRAPPGSRAAQRRQRKPTPTSLRATGAGAHSWQRLRLLEFSPPGIVRERAPAAAPPHQGSGRAAPGLPEPGHRPGWAWHHRVRRPRAAKVARRWYLARKVTEEGATRAAAHGRG